MAKFYTSRNGKQIEVKSFPHMLPAKVEVAARKKAEELYPAEIPTYDVPLMGGGVQTFLHDEKSVEGDAEATEKLRKYNEAIQKQTAHINEKMMQFYVLTGTVVKLPEDNSWEEIQRFFEVDIPTAGPDKLYHYITTELLVDIRDVMDLVQAIMEVSGIDQNTLDAARASFRGILGEEKDTVRRVDEPDQSAGTTSEVVHLAVVSSNGSDGEMAYTPLGVGDNDW